MQSCLCRNIGDTALDIRVGDIVKLKSGGPDMTVTRTENTQNDDVGVMWFDKAELHKGWFSVDALDMVQE